MSIALFSPIQLALVPLAWVYATALEWGIHRYLFHALGRRRGSRFAFHLRDHHRACRREGGADAAFGGGVWAWNAYGREVFGLILLALLHLPLLAVAPAAYLTLLVHGANYHRVHKRCHLDPKWCRAHAPWHWDHHMAPHADANWCVTSDWLDRLLGTRVEGERRQRRAA
ncbi:MAG: hypothetical protein H6741_29760 [Alphaproteobacteria bacterium]|nr:hypothetical protein [Alphaproteobacteria bacterium]MCB9796909.1 hypothetical protein [Alphaproteobacteria bacterium]